MIAGSVLGAKTAAIGRVRDAAGGDALILDVAATVVVNRLLSWASNRRDEDLLAWTTRACARFGNVRQFGALVRTAAPLTFADAVLRSAYELEMREIDVLSVQIGDVVDAVRLPPPANDVDLIDDAIDAALTELDDHDPAAAEHARAVSAWCARIARRLGCSDGDVRFARRAGLLADIGKLDVPYEILAARRPLTGDEWSTVRAHVVAGERRVAAHPALASFRAAVRGHHERPDGTGYPDGADTCALPLTTRIISVADAFNAMIAPRTYRAALRPADAIAELRRGAGTQFDPAVVDALVALVVGGAGGENVST